MHHIVFTDSVPITFPELEIKASVVQNERNELYLSLRIQKNGEPTHRGLTINAQDLPFLKRVIFEWERRLLKQEREENPREIIGVDHAQ